jgi:copper homeostasis protein
LERLLTTGGHLEAGAMSRPVVVEICVDSVESALAAARGGAHRVELCSNLLEGGTTPSAGLIETVRQKIGIALNVIIRPRGGDFCYSADEFECMKRDVLTVKQLGADGVVLGILDQEGHVDVARTRELVNLAHPMKVTFHRAYDMAADPFRALEDICKSGVDLLLTSGGEEECLQGAGKIAQIVRAAKNRVKVMAGGKIRPNNVAEVLESTGVNEIHVGFSRAVASPMVYRNPRVSLGKAKGREYERWEVHEEDVRELRSSIDASDPQASSERTSRDADLSGR